MNENTTIKVGKRRGFTAIDNEAVRDNSISLEARGLLAYLLSHSDGYHISVKQLLKIFDHEKRNLKKKHSRDFIYDTLNELIAAGYVIRTRLKKGGRFVGVSYEVYDIPPIAPEATTSESTVYGTAVSGNTISGSSVNIKKTNLLEEQKELEEKKGEEKPTPPPPVAVESHFEREETDSQKAAVAQMNGITPKHPLTVALQKITLGVSMAKLLTAAYRLHQLGATPDDLIGFTEWGAKNNLKGLIYPSQVVSNWLKYKPAAGVKVDLREALSQLRGIAHLQNGQRSAAWGQLPEGVRVVLSSEAKRQGCEVYKLLTLELA